MNTIIECKGLTKTFENHEALKNINLNLQVGRIIGLLGPNGSGKSTLLKIINGLLVPTSGSVLIDGNKPGIETKKIISYLPERNSLNNWMKVKELVTYYKDFYYDFCEEKAYDLLKKLDIDISAKMKTLSKGTKEKIQLILTMSREAKLYCLDEPIGGVDPASRDYIITTILNNYNPNATILISTHLILDIENILDEVIFINGGHIFRTATAEEIRTETDMTIDEFFRSEYRC